MEMKIIPVNGGGPGMDGVFLSGYGDGDYTPRPRSGPLPSLSITPWPCSTSISTRLKYLKLSKTRLSESGIVIFESVGL